MGYFCVGANSKLGADHPHLSYGTLGTPCIPLTDPYLSYLSKSMEDAIRKTAMDGHLINRGWNPSDKLHQEPWMPVEQKLFTQLAGKPFPKNGLPPAEDKLEYERKAINHC